MNWWQYLMLVNIYLLLFYGFYVLLLSRETFFQLNRIYLVSAALLSFFIPVIQSDWVRSLFITRQVTYTIYSSPVMFYKFQPIHDTQVTVGQLLVVIYLAGITFLLARIAWQLVVLKRVLDHPQASTAYSFFKQIQLGNDLENHDVIAAHEQAHARQWHSADVLIIEAVMIINWFNPVVYLYRFTMKHIHEFIADRQALKSGTNKADYALLLLSQTFNAPAHQLVNPFFNKSLLKQRIMMLQKNKSNRVMLIKYFLSAPLFVLMLVLSSATVNNSKPIQILNKKAQQVFLTSATEVAEAIQPVANKSTPIVNRLTTKSVDKSPAAKINDLTIAADTTPAKSDKVFTSVEHVPEFPGGLDAFIAFISKNIKYPAEARQNKVQGRVIISFIVEEDGALSNVHVARGIGYGADEEALRVIKSSPNWKPGTQNGHLVRVAYSVPISFSLDDGKPYNPTENKTGDVFGNQEPKEISLASMGVIVTKTDTGKKMDVINLKDPSLAPIYIVDGKEVNSLTMINPVDIESISVLKGKSSTALYGPRGANGVIVVTTKNNKLKLHPLDLKTDKQ
jgi:TonB family protein